MTAPAWLDDPDWPPRRCAYCGVGPQQVVCGLEHEAWTAAVSANVSSQVSNSSSLS
jgi:hypothetical protein